MSPTIFTTRKQTFCDGNLQQKSSLANLQQYCKYIARDNAVNVKSSQICNGSGRRKFARKLREMARNLLRTRVSRISVANLRRFYNERCPSIIYDGIARNS